MNKPSKNNIGKWVAALCLWLLCAQNQAAQFVEISAEIETFGYRLGDTNSMAKAKPKLVSVDCITGSSEWFIENDFQERQEWLFDGTTVVCRSRPLSAPDTSERANSKVMQEVWESRDGHPLGDFGVNIPWLAFCSGSYLKREGRIIPLPAAILRHCPDRFAYTDVTTTLDDELGLPKSIDLFTSKSRFLTSHADWDKDHAFGDR